MTHGYDTKHCNDIFELENISNCLQYHLIQIKGILLTAFALEVVRRYDVIRHVLYSAHFCLLNFGWQLIYVVFSLSVYF